MRYKLAIGVMAALTGTPGAWDHKSHCWVQDGAAYCPPPPPYAFQQADHADTSARALCEARFGANICAEGRGE